MNKKIFSFTLLNIIIQISTLIWNCKNARIDSGLHEMNLQKNNCFNRFTISHFGNSGR